MDHFKGMTAHFDSSFFIFLPRNFLIIQMMFSNPDKLVVEIV
jgi:hypothetical protein